METIAKIDTHRCQCITTKTRNINECTQFECMQVDTAVNEYHKKMPRGRNNTQQQCVHDPILLIDNGS